MVWVPLNVVELFRERSSEEENPHIFDFIEEFFLLHDTNQDILEFNFN